MSLTFKPPCWTKSKARMSLPPNIAAAIRALLSSEFFGSVEIELPETEGGISGRGAHSCTLQSRRDGYIFHVDMSENSTSIEFDKAGRWKQITIDFGIGAERYIIAPSGEMHANVDKYYLGVLWEKHRQMPMRCQDVLDIQELNKLIAPIVCVDRRVRGKHVAHKPVIYTYNEDDTIASVSLDDECVE